MNNTLALWLAVLIVGFFALDAFVFQMGAGTTVMRGILSLIRWVAFWR